MDESLGALFRTEYARLVRAIVVAGASPEDAADAVQDAFVQAHRHWSRVCGYDDPAVWLRRVAVNRSLNARRGFLRRSRPLPPAIPKGDSATERLDVVAALRRLPPQQRLAVTLYYVGDLSIEQVADAMCVAPGTVKAHLHSARAHLAVELEGVVSD